jgi:hypothetical protein
MEQILDEIATRRRRQIDKGYDAAHDDAHDKGEIAMGAAAYCISSVKYEGNGRPGYKTIPQWAPPFWPWERDQFRPTNARDNLIDAAAMIVAEIERLDRAAQTP